MVRVCFSSLLPLVLLVGCATGQAQAPVSPPAQVNNAPENETLADCARKSSVAGAWSCVAGDKTSP
jgi:hypothetical protein